MRCPRRLQPFHACVASFLCDNDDRPLFLTVCLRVLFFIFSFSSFSFYLLFSCTPLLPLSRLASAPPPPPRKVLNARFRDFPPLFAPAPPHPLFPLSLPNLCMFLVSPLGRLPPGRSSQTILPSPPYILHSVTYAIQWFRSFSLGSPRFSAAHPSGDPLRYPEVAPFLVLPVGDGSMFFFRLPFFGFSLFHFIYPCFSPT